MKRTTTITDKQIYLLKDVMARSSSFNYKDRWEAAVRCGIDGHYVACGRSNVLGYCSGCNKKTVTISQRFGGDEYCIDCDPNTPEWTSSEFDLYQSISVIQCLRTVRFLVMGIDISYAFWLGHNLAVVGDDILKEYIKQFGTDDYMLHNELLDREMEKEWVEELNKQEE